VARELFEFLEVWWQSGETDLEVFAPLYAENWTSDRLSLSVVNWLAGPTVEFDMLLHGLKDRPANPTGNIKAVMKPRLEQFAESLLYQAGVHGASLTRALGLGGEGSSSTVSSSAASTIPPVAADDGDSSTVRG